jgi:hypothetical protein
MRAKERDDLRALATRWENEAQRHREAAMECGGPEPSESDLEERLNHEVEAHALYRCVVDLLRVLR